MVCCCLPLPWMLPVEKSATNKASHPCTPLGSPTETNLPHHLNTVPSEASCTHGSTPQTAQMAPGAPAHDPPAGVCKLIEQASIPDIPCLIVHLTVCTRGSKELLS